MGSLAQRKNSSDLSSVVLSTVFPIAGVTNKSKMYRTFAASDLRSDLHFAQKNKMYAIHFAKKIYTLILKPHNLYVQSRAKVFLYFVFMVSYFALDLLPNRDMT
jgi:hypothetical protein